VRAGDGVRARVRSHALALALVLALVHAVLLHA
jgi:hypothetical protein